jgi:hypothetical protein
METTLRPYSSFSGCPEEREEREIVVEDGTDAIAELTKEAVCGIVYRDENDRTRYKGVFAKRD